MRHSNPGYTGIRVIWLFDVSKHSSRTDQSHRFDQNIMHDYMALGNIIQARRLADGALRRKDHRPVPWPVERRPVSDTLCVHRSAIAFQMSF